MPWLVERAGSMCPGARRVEIAGCHLNDCMASSQHKNSFHWARLCLQDRYQHVWRLALNETQQCRFCFGAAEGVFRARAVRRLEQKDRWDKEMIEAQVRVPWERTDGRWIVGRLEVRVDPVPPPPRPFDAMRFQRGNITEWDIKAHGATQSRMGRHHKRIQIDVAAELKPASKQHHKEQSDSSDEAMWYTSHRQEKLKATTRGRMSMKRQRRPVRRSKK